MDGYCLADVSAYWGFGTVEKAAASLQTTLPADDLAQAFSSVYGAEAVDYVVVIFCFWI